MGQRPSEGRHGVKGEGRESTSSSNRGDGSAVSVCETELLILLFEGREIGLNPVKGTYLEDKTMDRCFWAKSKSLPTTSKACGPFHFPRGWVTLGNGLAVGGCPLILVSKNKLMLPTVF